MIVVVTAMMAAMKIVGDGVISSSWSDASGDDGSIDI